MYRRHLRMVLARDLESNKSKSEFVQRIASIPVVYLAWNIAAETYNNVKAANRLLKVSLNTTEKAAYFISEPVFRRFERQLKSADYMACRGLETLQGIVPGILNQREKIVDIVNDGTEKLEEFLASPYGEVCDVALDFALDVGEMYVDHFLPPLGDERPEKLFGDRAKEPFTKRTELLRNRVKERLYKHSLLKIQTIRLRTKLFVFKIYRINPYKYIVETSAAVPETLYSTVVRVFTSFENMILYLVYMLKGHHEESIV